MLKIYATRTFLLEKSLINKATLNEIVAEKKAKKLCNNRRDGVNNGGGENAIFCEQRKKRKQ